MTPDIDTQEFMGDLMWSNTYMTQRIPANWNDPEYVLAEQFFLALEVDCPLIANSLPAFITLSPFLSLHLSLSVSVSSSVIDPSFLSFFYQTHT